MYRIFSEHALRPVTSLDGLWEMELGGNRYPMLIPGVWALKYGGDFFLVHKPERLAQIIALAAGQKLEAKRLLLLRHRENGPVALILLQLRKGAKPGLKIEEAALYDPRGNPTAYHKAVYHME